MKYYISDMHFFHKNVTKEGNNFDNRPFNSLAEMHQYMKEKWNSKITNGDTVYILGDIAMRGTNEELIALVAQLKGRKVLIKGNHDEMCIRDSEQKVELIRDEQERKSSDMQNYVATVIAVFGLISIVASLSLIHI